MKFKVLFTILACLFIATAAVAGTVTFQWDASVGAEGYNLYVRSATSTYDYTVPAWTGTALTASITLDGGTYAAVVRAYNGEGESGDSNEVTFSLVPNAPQNFVVIFQ